MYTIKPYETKILLISNGEPQDIYEYDSYDKFLTYIHAHFVSSRVVNKFKKGSKEDTWTTDELELEFGHALLRYELKYERDYINGKYVKSTLYIVRDEFGSVISKKEILHALKIKDHELYLERIKKHKRWGWYSHVPYEYRKDPVPGVSNSHWGGHRKLRTTQELRRNCGEPEFTRKRRTKRYLPNNWWDLPTTRKGNSWKHYRKTQWK